MRHESPVFWDDPNQEEDMHYVRQVADTYDFGRHDDTLRSRAVSPMLG